jgi:hypothetical protein
MHFFFFFLRISEKDAFLLDSNLNQSKWTCLRSNEKPLNFEISKSDVIARQCAKKDTFQENFPLSPAFLRYFENKKRRRYLCSKNSIFQDLMNKKRKKVTKFLIPLLNFNVNPEFISFFLICLFLDFSSVLLGNLRCSFLNWFNFLKQ